MIRRGPDRGGCAGLDHRSVQNYHKKGLRRLLNEHLSPPGSAGWWWRTKADSSDSKLHGLLPLAKPGPVEVVILLQGKDPTLEEEWAENDLARLGPLKWELVAEESRVARCMKPAGGRRPPHDRRA
jgi:hypothetical protein